MLLLRSTKDKSSQQKIVTIRTIFFSFRPAHFKVEKHTTEIPVILLSKDVGNPSRVKNQGDRQMILIWLLANNSEPLKWLKDLTPYL